MKRYNSLLQTSPMIAVNPFSIETIAYEVTTFLAFEDLQNWRQCSRTTEKSFRDYFFGTNTPNGMRARFYDYLRADFGEATDHILQFQQDAQALISGSFVLKFFAKHSWDVKDLDLIVPLNEKSIAAFVVLVKAIVPPKDDPDDDDDDDFAYNIGGEHDDDDNPYWDYSNLSHITKFDSLDRQSVQPKDGASCLATGKQKNSAEYNAYMKLMRRKFSPLRSMCESYGYNKHVRAIFFAIDQLKQDKRRKMDVVFVPEVDLQATGGLLNWMKYNFDFQICANAITPTSAYCLAPLEIASRMAYCRMDQYCCDAKIEDKPPPKRTRNRYSRSWDEDEKAPFVTLTEEVRWERDWDGGDGGMCACTEIVPNRIKKYHERGYFVLTGTCKEYQEWRAQNYT